MQVSKSKNDDPLEEIGDNEDDPLDDLGESEN